jgi:hypothetical protein
MPNKNRRTDLSGKPRASKWVGKREEQNYKLRWWGSIFLAVIIAHITYAGAADLIPLALGLAGPWVYYVFGNRCVSGKTDGGIH